MSFLTPAQRAAQEQAAYQIGFDYGKTLTASSPYRPVMIDLVNTMKNLKQTAEPELIKMMPDLG